MLRLRLSNQLTLWDEGPFVNTSFDGTSSILAIGLRGIAPSKDKTSRTGDAPMAEKARRLRGQRALTCMYGELLAQLGVERMGGKQLGYLGLYGS